MEGECDQNEFVIVLADERIAADAGDGIGGMMVDEDDDRGGGMTS